MRAQRSPGGGEARAPPPQTSRNHVGTLTSKMALASTLVLPAFSLQWCAHLHLPNSTWLQPPNPDRVTGDKHPSPPRALHRELGAAFRSRGAAGNSRLTQECSRLPATCLSALHAGHRRRPAAGVRMPRTRPRSSSSLPVSRQALHAAETTRPVGLQRGRARSSRAAAWTQGTRVLVCYPERLSAQEKVGTQANSHAQDHKLEKTSKHKRL